MTPNLSKIWQYQPPHGACSKGIPAEPPPASSFAMSSLASSGVSVVESNEQALPSKF